MNSTQQLAFRGARWLLLATVLVPVVIDPKAWFPFVTTRAVYFRVLVELATACLLVLVLRHETRATFRRDPIFWALLAFTAVTAVATAFSPAPWRSLYGDYGRMGGLWAWLHLFVFYVGLRTVFDERDWRRYFRATVGVALAVCVYGFIQYYNDLLLLPWEGSPRSAIHATVGNSGLLAIYLGLTFGLLVYLGATSPGRRRILYVLPGSALLFAIGLAQNRSTVLGGIAGIGAGLAFYAIVARPRRRVLLAAGVAIVAAGLLLPLLASVPAVNRAVSVTPLGAKLSQGVDPTRVLQWRAAMNGIRERPLLGYGPENYHLVWSRFSEPEMLRYIDDQLVWDRAHNAYLDVFATTGVFGLLAFLAVWIAITWTLISGTRTNSFSAAESATLAGIIVLYAVYLCFWFFDLNSTMLWIAIAAYVGSRASGQPAIRFGVPLSLRPQSRIILVGGALALGATLYVQGYETLRLARILHRIEAAKQQPLAMLRDFSMAFDSRAPDTHHTFLLYSDYLRTLLPRFAEMRQDPELRAALDTAFTRAFVAVERETRRDPLNERMVGQKARIALLAWAYYGTPRFREIAVASLYRAVELAPSRVPSRLALATALESSGQMDSARAQLEYALKLYPAFAPARRALVSLHLKAGQPEMAAVWLRSLFAYGQLDNAVQISRVAEEIMRRGEYGRADSLLSAYFARKYGPLVVWPAQPTGGIPLEEEARLARIWGDALRHRGEATRAAGVGQAISNWCDNAPMTELTALGKFPVAGLRGPSRHLSLTLDGLSRSSRRKLDVVDYDAIATPSCSDPQLHAALFTDRRQ